MNKKIIQKKELGRNGFTLVELLFACAILGFMLTITLVTFIGVFRFYIWSKTTRTTQEASRQVLTTMTREIQSRQISSVRDNGTFLCLKDPSSISQPSYSISLDKGRILTHGYSDKDCSTVLAGSVSTISAQTITVSNLKFTQVNGPTISPLIVPAKSVTIDMQVTNGNAVNGVCAPADNFCDQATFTTAVMQR